MNKKVYILPLTEEITLETAAGVLAGSVSIGQLSFGDEGGSTELQEDALEDGVGGLSRGFGLFGE